MHTIYRVVAAGREYSDLVDEFIESKAFEHMFHSTHCQTWGLFREDISLCRESRFEEAAVSNLLPWGITWWHSIYGGGCWFVQNPLQLGSGSKYCKLTTPLDSTTAHMLCNIAIIRSVETILDPFAGSAANWLAASLIASDTQTMGIRVASNEVLSCENIRQDFVSLGLKPPLVVLEGDAMNESTRDNARRLIGVKHLMLS